MIENQTLQAFPIFGDNASKVQPEAAVYTNGYAPNDVLPAEHFNWFMGNASNAITILNQGISSIEAELNTLIACAGMTSDVSCTSQVYNAVMYQINNCISKYAIKNHASNTNTYGLGNAANYGHVQLSDAINSSCGVANGVAATPLAVKTVSDKLNALCGDRLPKQLGSAVVGTSSKFAREDHVHPTTGLAVISKENTSYYGIILPSDSPNWMRTPFSGLLPYTNDCVNGFGCVGDPSFPFKAMYAKCFFGKAACASLIETSVYCSNNAYRKLMIAESSSFGNDRLKGSDNLEVWIDNSATYLSVGCRSIGNPGIFYLWNGCTGHASIETSHKTATTVSFCLPDVGGTLATTSSTVACATNATNATCASEAYCSYKAQYAAKLNFYNDNVNIDKKILCCYVGTSAQQYYLYVVNCTNNNLLGVFTDYGSERNIKIISAGEGVCLYCNSCCSCVVNAKTFTSYIKLG